MSATVFDYRWQRYEMTCKLWRDKHKHYRFMGQGGGRISCSSTILTIPKEGRLTQCVTINLWAFRSRALLPEVRDDGGEEEPRHSDGALRLSATVTSKFSPLIFSSPAAVPPIPHYHYKISFSISTINLLSTNNYSWTHSTVFRVINSDTLDLEGERRGPTRRGRCRGHRCGHRVPPTRRMQGEGEGQRPPLQLASGCCSCSTRRRGWRVTNEIQATNFLEQMAVEALPLFRARVVIPKRKRTERRRV
jgi:hypothetical protein